MIQDSNTDNPQEIEATEEGLLAAAEEAIQAAQDAPEEPQEADEEIPVLVLRNMVLFPGIVMPVKLSRPEAQQLTLEAFANNQRIAVVCQKDPKTTKVGADDIYPVGVLAQVVNFEGPKRSRTVVLQAEERIMLRQITATEPYMKATYKFMPERSANGDPVLAKPLQMLVKCAKTIAEFNNHPFDEAQLERIVEQSYDLAINGLCTTFSISTQQMQELLCYDSLRQRAVYLVGIVVEIQAQLVVSQEVKQTTEKRISKQQREYLLQQEMRTIQEELGDSATQEHNEMKLQGASKNWPASVHARFEKELRKLERMDQHNPEYSVQRSYLELMLQLPWDDLSTDNRSIPHAEKILNRDHFGMDDVKERILEYLASSRKSGMILCLWGPPGVGKTSLCRSVADALGRKYARISLGGMHDESELRGHRRTYIGAMPGRIIENLKKVGTSNPVFVLDEIDKLCADHQGDPSSALLEVLDPEQNRTFHDNYLDIDYDLSQVLFIATANTLQSIPRPLLDRMELVEMSGYIQEEKEQIAKRYLIPKHLREQDLTAKDLRFSAKAIRTIINEYTLESGVRGLDRQVGSVVRKIVKRRAMEQPYSPLLQPSDIYDLLGKKRVLRDRYEGNDYPGVVTGLAWTSVGGEILFIETATSISKTPALTLTGNLGDVMKESATIALTYIRSHAADFGIDPTFFDDKAVHLHVPEGATPKDGPSAGITMTTAMVSCFTGRKVRERLAMTGEMTLRGKVLPVGGIKEKILAAKRAGIQTILLCQDNEKDILDIPALYTDGLTFHYVKDIHEVIDFALL